MTSIPNHYFQEAAAAAPLSITNAKELASLSRYAIEEKVMTLPLFEYVRDENKSTAIQLLDEVNTKSDTQEKIQHLAHLLNERFDPKDPLLEDKDLIHLTTLALFHEIITEEQLATVCMNASMKEFYHRKEVLEVLSSKELSADFISIPLFIDDVINPEAWKLIEQNIEQNSVHTRILQKEDMGRWFEEMRKKPVSERHFYVAPLFNKGKEGIMFNPTDLSDPQLVRKELINKLKELIDLEHNPATLPTVMDAAENAGSNLFYQTEFKKMKYRILPSLGMADACKKLVQKTAEEFQIIPRFGMRHSSKSPINTRDVTVRNPYQKSSRFADNFSAPASELSYHDAVYHSILCAHMPEELQYFYTQLGDAVETYMTKKALVPETVEYILYNRLKNMFYDMETLSLFSSKEMMKISETDSEETIRNIYFWNTLSTIYMVAILGVPQEMIFEMRYKPHSQITEQDLNDIYQVESSSEQIYSITKDCLVHCFRSARASFLELNMNLDEEIATITLSTISEETIYDKMRFDFILAGISTIMAPHERL